jgi:hypothetical protein
MGDDPERDHADLPSVPAFFSPDDLPSWLRPEAEAQPAPTHDTRARVAWVNGLSTDAEPHETPFRTAPDATWDLLTPPRRTARRAKHGADSR